MKETTSSTTTSAYEFMPIQALIRASWERVKLTWVNLLVLYLILFATSFVLSFIIVIAVLGGGVMSGLTAANGQGMEQVIMSSLATMAPVAIGSFAMLLIIMTVVGVIFGAAMLLTVAKAEEKPTLGSVISTGAKLFWSMLLTSLLVGFLVMGGMFLFLIPGLIIAIFMSFSSYEVVLADQKYLQAMKNSATIIKQHFGALFVRYLVLIGISIAISVFDLIVQAIFSDVPAISGLFSLLSLVVQAVAGFFSICYVYLLYREARAQTNFNQPASMTWMWIVSIIGWVIGVIMLMVMGIALGALLKSGLVQDAVKNEMMPDSDPYSYDYYASESGTMMESDIGAANADQLIEQYGSEMTEEEKEMLRSIINATE